MRILFVIYIFSLLIILEITTRFFDKIPIFSLQNWVTHFLEINLTNETSTYDSLLGWSGKKNISLRGLNLNNISNSSDWKINHDSNGFRYTGEKKNTKKKIVTVGDSFTWGSEVSDLESYPAILQKLTNLDVINISYGGWGTDQMWLSMKKNLNSINPQIIIKSPLTNDVLRNAYRRYGRAFKPYFTKDSENILHLKNVPVEKNSTKIKDIGLLQSLFGRFYFFTFVFKNIGLGNFWINNEKLYDKVMSNAESVEVACLILRDIKNDNILKDKHFLLVLLYGYQEVLKEERFWFTKQYISCAEKYKINILDTYDDFLAQAKKKNFPEIFYNRHLDGKFGHMNYEGNKFVAKLISNYLEKKGW